MDEPLAVGGGAAHWCFLLAMPGTMLQAKQLKWMEKIP